MTFVTPDTTLLQSPLQRKGQMMEFDNLGNPVDFNEVMAYWYSTAEAGEKLGIGQAAITYLCREKKLRAYRVMRQWRVEPQSVADYIPEKPGRKSKD